MKNLDIKFQTRNTTIGILIGENYTTPYDGILTSSQISTVIESLILQLPMPKLFADSTKKEIFANGHIVSAVRDFQRCSNIKLKNTTGFLLETFQNKNWSELENWTCNRITSNSIIVETAYGVDNETIEKLKDMIFNVSAPKTFVVCDQIS